MKARLPKGMGGGPQNMQAMLKQAQKMQEDVKKAVILQPDSPKSPVALVCIGPKLPTMVPKLF